MESIHSFLRPVDFAVVGIYLLVLIGIGYWVSFIKKRNTEDNLFLAGRSLGWLSIGLTMWGTNVGPSMLIASASIGYTSGIVAGNFAWYAFVFIFLLAVVFAPRYLASKVQTLPEYMGKRFGSSTRNILAWYTVITTIISWLALQLFAGGVLITQLLNIPMWMAVAGLIAISAFFTIAGGLKAIAWTNVFQMILLILVSFVLTAVAVFKAGGPVAIFEQTPPHYWNLLRPMDDPNYPWLAILLGYPIMGVWFWCTDQSMVQSVLGARSLKQGQIGANFIGWLKILDVALFILPGMICFILYPELKNPDEAYMTLVTRLFPAGMTGLVMAVLIAALVSTIDSALNSLSTVFTMDIYVKNYKPAATQTEIIKTGRIVAFTGGAIAVLLALAINSIRGLNLFDIFQAILGFLAPPMAVVFLSGVLWKRTTRLAANLALSLGTLISLGTGVLYLWVFPAEKYDFWPHFLLVSFILFIVIAAMTVLVSLAGPKYKEEERAPVLPVKIPSTSRQVWIAWIILIIFMIGMYIVFDGHR